MSKISALEKEQTRQRILEASRTAFRKEGYNGTQLKQIAKEVGVGVSTLYGYYPSKSELFVSAFIDIIDTSRWDEDQISEYLKLGLSEAIYEIFVNDKLNNAGEDRKLVKEFYIQSLKDDRFKTTQKKICNQLERLDYLRSILEIYEREKLRICPFSLNHLAMGILIFVDSIGKQFIFSNQMDADELKVKLIEQLNVLFAGKYEDY